MIQDKIQNNILQQKFVSCHRNSRKKRCKWNEPEKFRTLQYIIPHSNFLHKIQTFLCCKHRNNFCCISINIAQILKKIPAKLYTFLLDSNKKMLGYFIPIYACRNLYFDLTNDHFTHERLTLHWKCSFPKQNELWMPPTRGHLGPI